MSNWGQTGRRAEDTYQERTQGGAARQGRGYGYGQKPEEYEQQGRTGIFGHKEGSGTGQGTRWGQETGSGMRGQGTSDEPGYGYGQTTSGRQGWGQQEGTGMGSGRWEQQGTGTGYGQYGQREQMASERWGQQPGMEGQKYGQEHGVGTERLPQQQPGREQRYSQSSETSEGSGKEHHESLLGKMKDKFTK